MGLFCCWQIFSINSRKRFWGKGAIDTISKSLENELPGLKGFSARNLRNMRLFYEQWAILDNFTDEKKFLETSNLADASAKIPKIAILDDKHNSFDKIKDFPVFDFLHVSFPIIY